MSPRLIVSGGVLAALLGLGVALQASAVESALVTDARRAVATAGAGTEIEVSGDGRSITLQGFASADDADRVVQSIEALDGVRNINDELAPAEGGLIVIDLATDQRTVDATLGREPQVERLAAALDSALGVFEYRYHLRSDVALSEATLTRAIAMADDSTDRFETARIEVGNDRSTITGTLRAGEDLEMAQQHYAMFETPEHQISLDLSPSEAQSTAQETEEP